MTDRTRFVLRMAVRYMQVHLDDVCEMFQVEADMDPPLAQIDGEVGMMPTDRELVEINLSLEEKSDGRDYA
jgi:hypothetical protein